MNAEDVAGSFAVPEGPLTAKELSQRMHADDRWTVLVDPVFFNQGYLYASMQSKDGSVRLHLLYTVADEKAPTGDDQYVLLDVAVLKQ
jgi:hypothetical protein